MLGYYSIATRIEALKQAMEAQVGSWFSDGGCPVDDDVLLDAATLGQKEWKCDQVSKRLLVPP